MLKYFLLFFIFFNSSAWGKPLVVASFSILADMIQQIAQDKADVSSLVGPNQDAHVFEPRPQHAKTLEKADLILVNGLGFEGWMERLISTSGYKGNIHVASAGIPPLYHKTSKRTQSVDPHAWHSLKNATIYVDNITEALSNLLPHEKAFFEAQAKIYKKKLTSLRKKIEKELQSIPLDQRKVLTNHEAFAYLGREFQIMFYSPLGMSTEAEASAKAIALLIQKVRKEGINAVFVENILNPRLVKQIARETGTQIAGSLYSDALDAPGTQGATYLEMMHFNLHSLVKALKNNRFSKPEPSPKS